jgi:hypothetical protein
MSRASSGLADDVRRSVIDCSYRGRRPGQRDARAGTWRAISSGHLPRRDDAWLITDSCVSAHQAVRWDRSDRGRQAGKASGVECRRLPEEERTKLHAKLAPLTRSWPDLARMQPHRAATYPHAHARAGELLVEGSGLPRGLPRGGEHPASPHLYMHAACRGCWCIIETSINLFLATEPRLRAAHLL